MILNPSFPSPLLDAFPRCYPLPSTKINRSGQESPPPSPGWTGCSSWNAAQETWWEPRASALVLPGMNRHLRLEVQSEALLDHKGSICLLIQRRSPQLGPRALSLGVRFLLPLTLSSQPGFLHSPLTPQHRAPTHPLPHPASQLCFMAHPSYRKPPSICPSPAPTTTQSPSWVCCSHLGRWPGMHLSLPLSREHLENQGRASFSNPGFTPSPPHSHTLCPPLPTPGPPVPLCKGRR